MIKEEIKRQFSIHTSVVPMSGIIKINILDTPGYFDFAGRGRGGAVSADAAIIVVSGKAGIGQAQKEHGRYARNISSADDLCDGHGYRQCKLPRSGNLQALYGKKIAPFHLPIRENEKFVGYVNVIQQRAKRWNESGGVDKFDVPEYSKEPGNMP